MKVQVKVFQDEFEVEIMNEIELDFELDVTDKEFTSLINHLSGELTKLIYTMLKGKSQKIITPGLAE